MTVRTASLASRFPPLLIAATLLVEVVAVYAAERWLLRGGLTPTAVHAQQRINREIDVRFQQGVLMLHAQQYDHALTAFHRLLQLEPRMPEAHVNMGYAMLGKGSHKEAADFFRGALALRPGQANAHYGLALALDGLGQRQEALEAMHLYLMETVPEDPYRQKAEVTLRAWRDAMDVKPVPTGKLPAKHGAGNAAK